MLFLTAVVLSQLPSPPLTCEILLETGTNLNLRATGQYCVSLTTEVECGTLNYVFLSGEFRQCGWANGECLAKYGDLVCPQTPPPPLTCEALLAFGANLNDSDQYCVGLTTEGECGTLNYVSLSGVYRQCGWRFGQCLAKYGDLVCPISASPPPPPATYAKTITLPVDLRAEGVVGGKGPFLFAGSWADGRIMKVNTATNVVVELVGPLPPTDTLETSERATLGLCYDPLTDVVWASGGPSAEARAFDGETGEMLGAWIVTPNESLGARGSYAAGPCRRVGPWRTSPRASHH
jgi:hypothetical protein